ncbi:hypothetical protein ETB97_002222 [Aspergillus alliaceus]|uniref:chitinase n=1 Tax=Petromyces alliaceus TaxID=209559 RepID=A0A8H6E651_PETAA|nr:hypothetical protein ETB97_002222 [Aspergillus burnettii]
MIPCPPGKEVATYYASWSQWTWPVSNLRADRLTLVLYAFARVSPNGEVEAPDPDFDKPARELSELKERHPQLKVVVSIGGDAYSVNFPAVAGDTDKRQTFAQTAINLAQKYKFDGIDVDWEFPMNVQDGKNFTLLLKECRKKLGQKGIITVATTPNALWYEYLDFSGMHDVVDFYNLMAYNFAGSWNKTAGHCSNLHNDPGSGATFVSVDKVVQNYKGKGVDVSKVLLGIPLYGVIFDGTDGPGKPYTSIPGENPSYKDLPKSGAKEEYSDRAGASWSYDASKKEMVSYDSMEEIVEKGKYVKTHGLGGGFFWDAAKDKQGKGNAVVIFADALQREF